MLLPTAIEELLRRGARVVGTLHSSPPVIEDPAVEYRRVDLSRKEDCATAVQGCEMAIIAAACAAVCVYTSTRHDGTPVVPPAVAMNDA